MAREHAAQDQERHRDRGLEGEAQCQHHGVAGVGKESVADAVVRVDEHEQAGIGGGPPDRLEVGIVEAAPAPGRPDDDALHMRMAGDASQLGGAGLRPLQRQHAEAQQPAVRLDADLLKIVVELGGHVHQSLWDGKTGKSLFHAPGGRAGMSPLMESYVAGQLQHMRELTALLAPTVNSYTRLVKGAWAPTTATWGIDNRTTAIRIVPGSEKAQRVEYRLAASDAHPYLVVATNLASGLEGIDRKLVLPPPVTGNAYEAQGALPEASQLPATLREATAVFSRSEMARQWFGDAFVDHFAASRDWETRQFERAVTDWELARYFEII